MSLSQFLTNIANAIRSKKGTTESILAANFATEIENLETGGASEYFKNTLEVETSGSVSYKPTGIVKLLKNIPPFTLLNNSADKLFYKCESLISIPNIDTSNCISFESCFAFCISLKELKQFNTSKGQNLTRFLQNCNNLETVSNLNISECTNITSMFQNCSKLKSIPELDCGKVITINDPLYGCTSLIDFGGFKDIGKAFTQKQNNYYNYRISMSNLDSTIISKESLMNVIINLYDLNLTYNVANGGTLYVQQLILGTNKEKLIAAEIAMITRKGWIAS